MPFTTFSTFGFLILATKRVKLANNLKSARKFAALADIFARFGDAR
jgi:hypothetical protein